jgi:hypothetical protein
MRTHLGLALVLGLLAPAATSQVQLHKPGQAWQGLHLDISLLEKVNPEVNPRARVLDMNGNLLHSWQNPVPLWGFAELVKPLPQGHLLAMVYERSTAGGGQAIHKGIVELDWNGALVWAYDPSPLGYTVHHDFERLPNGNTILLGQTQANYPALNPGPILDEFILEVNPAGAIVWSWSSAQNASEFPLSAEGWNYLYNYNGNPGAAIFHTNSIQSLPPNKWEHADPRFAAGNLMVSFREMSLVVIIERATGQIVWAFEKAIGQHHARMIPEGQGLPGEGNILIFDNGGVSGAPPTERVYSRVIEIHPRTHKILWSYETPPVAGGLARAGGPGGPGGLNVTQSVRPSFFTKTMGACQRLPNGNTVITESESGRVFEVTRNGQIVWQFQKIIGEKVYRTYRVDTAWPQGAFTFPW